MALDFGKEFTKFPDVQARERVKAKEQFFLSSIGGGSLARTGTLQGMAIVGISTPGDGDSTFRFIVPRDMTIHKLVVSAGKVSSTFDDVIIIKVNKEGAWTGMQVTIPAGASGIFIDEQHAFDIDEGEYLVYNLDLSAPTAGVIQSLEISLIGE